MNHTYRFLLGLLSSGLLSVGLVSAADRFDPTAKSRAFAQTDGIHPPAPDCILNCWEAGSSASDLAAADRATL